MGKKRAIITAVSLVVGIMYLYVLMFNRGSDGHNIKAMVFVTGIGAIIILFVILTDNMEPKKRHIILTVAAGIFLAVNLTDALYSAGNRGVAYGLAEYCYSEGPDVYMTGDYTNKNGEVRTFDLKLCLEPKSVPYHKKVLLIHDSPSGEVQSFWGLFVRYLASAVLFSWAVSKLKKPVGLLDDRY